MKKASKMVKAVAKKMKKVEPKFYGYKVVRKVGGKLVSCSVGKMIVQYVSDKFVSPRTFSGPLTLFTNPYQAIGFIQKLDHKEQMRVYRCEYVPTEVNYAFRGLVDGMEVRKDFPDGTILARKIKILKKVF